jgi:hypothetical protein
MYERNIHELFREFNRENRSATIETNFPSNRDSFPVMQRHASAIAEGLDGKFERNLSELEKTPQLMKQPNKKCPSDQRVFLKTLIERIAVKSICFLPINHQLSKEMIQCAHIDFSVSRYNTLTPHIKRLAGVY